MSIKALSLFSGGLDSMLAIKLIREQGIDVIALNFDIGFESVDKEDFLKRACDEMGVELRILDIKKQFFDEVLFEPKYGYGKYFNPCIDCHANMIRHAKALFDECGASFIITGEVVGQRPKSQRAEALCQVNKLSGAEGLVLRPLSAKLMEPTIPETEGWVDRERLLGISGRGRSKQLELVKTYNIKEYSPPAGGCMLTQETQSDKIRDLVDAKAFSVESIPLIHTGRYYVLPDGARLIVSRNAEENGELENLESKDFEFFRVENFLGPVSVITKNASKADRELARKITITQGKNEQYKKYEAEIGGERLSEEAYGSKEETHQYFLQNMQKD